MRTKRVMRRFLIFVTCLLYLVTTPTITSATETPGLEDFTTVDSNGIEISNLASANINPEPLDSPSLQYSIEPTGVQLDWNPVEGAYQYDIYYSATPFNNLDYYLMDQTQDTSVLITKVPENEDLYFAVRAIGDEGESELSNIVRVKIIEIEVPTGLSVKEVGDNLQISWDAIDYVDGYNVSVNGGPNIWRTTNQANYTLVAPKRGTTYNFSVQGKIDDVTGTSATVSYFFENKVTPKPTATPKPKPTVIAKPVAPTGISATTSATKVATISWKRVSNATSYEILRSNKKTSGFKSIKSLGANATSFKDTSVAEGKTYYYKVRSKNSAGFKDSGVMTVKTIARTTSLKVKKSGNNLIVSYKNPEKNVQIQVSRRKSSGYKNVATSKKNVLTVGNRKIKNALKLEKGKSYNLYVRTRSFRVINGKRVYGSWTTSKVVKNFKIK